MTLEDLFAVRSTRLPRVSNHDLADVGRAIDRRHMDEIHPCVFCGEQARAPLVANASDLFGRAGWLDLCPACNLALRELFLSDPFLDDAEIIRRYEEWAASRRAGDSVHRSEPQP
jgi:hypothetical protein